MECALATATLLAGAAAAQPAPATTQADLDLIIRRGTLATLAPLCRMRDQRWGEDLRRGALQDATGAPSPDDPALAAAPDSDRAQAALGYAEAEALEAFAETAPAASCRRLAQDPGFADADARVAAYRADMTRRERQY